MEAKITALDDVTREIELTFGDGSVAFAQLQVDEHIDGVGDFNFERHFRDVFSIKIILASDVVGNEEHKKNEREETDRADMAGERQWATAEAHQAGALGAR